MNAAQFAGKETNKRSPIFAVCYSAQAGFCLQLHDFRDRFILHGGDVGLAHFVLLEGRVRCEELGRRSEPKCSALKGGLRLISVMLSCLLFSEILGV